MIATFRNLPLFDKSLVIGGALVLILFLVLQIKRYLSKIDASYLDQLSGFSKHNRREAKKAGHVALHELSFSWLKGVKMRVRALPVQPNSRNEQNPRFVLRRHAPKKK